MPVFMCLTLHHCWP